MKKILLLIVVISSFALCSYSVGQTISINDQQLTREVCYGSEYEIGDDFSLYDLNGDYNGGTYHVLFFDMSATW